MTFVGIKFFPLFVSTKKLYIFDFLYSLNPIKKTKQKKFFNFLNYAVYNIFRRTKTYSEKTILCINKELIAL